MWNKLSHSYSQITRAAAQIKKPGWLRFEAFTGSFIPPFTVQPPGDDAVDQVIPVRYGGKQVMKGLAR